MDRVVDAVCSVQDGPAVVVDLVAYPGRGAVALAVNVAQYNAFSSLGCTPYRLRENCQTLGRASVLDGTGPKWWRHPTSPIPRSRVVVPRLDRLARNLSEGLRTIEELHAQGIHIRALTENLDTSDDSPNARLMLHMLLSLAEWERGTIRDRIKTGVDRAAAEGRTGGRPPALDSEKLRAVRDFLATADRSAWPPGRSG